MAKRMRITPKNTKNTTSGKKVIVYDGLCTMCKDLANGIDHSSKKERFTTTDLTTSVLPSNISRQDAEKEIHVIDTDGRIYKNADAILKVLEEYPRFAWLARVGRIPGIKQLLAGVYKIVAVNRHFIAGPASRVFWLKFTICLAFLTSMLVSLRVWSNERAFPLAPLFSWLPSFSHPYDLMLLVALITLLIAAICSAKPKKYILIFIGVLLCTALFDQMRWQPWVFQYTAMLAALVFFSWRASDETGQRRVLNICRLIIATTYIWSGLHKISAAFIYTVFPWMLEPVTNHLPTAIHEYSYAAGAFISLVEMSIGIGLLTKKFRKIAILAAIGMHLSILGLIGPLGHDWNAVVWPWNVAMIVFDLLLFWNLKTTRFWDIVWGRGHAYHAMILTLFGILPMLSLFGHWDMYLSSALYSGDTQQATVYVSSHTERLLPASITDSSTSTGKDRFSISVTSLSFNTLRVPPYPETRVYKQIGRHFCMYDKESTLLYIHQDATPFHQSYSKIYTCDQLTN